MANIIDVAKEAKVSISTVSKVLNNPNYGSEETRKNVLNVVKKLRYITNRIAKSMVQGKTGIIALLIADIRNPFFTNLSRGVEDVANKYNYTVIICNTDEDSKKERDYIDILQSRIVDGFIIATTTEDNELLQQVDHEKLPFVFVHRKVSDIIADSVILDNKEGAYSAIRYLLELGHRRIGFITAKRNISTGKQRFLGYIKALKEFNVSIDKKLIEDGGYTIEEGYNSVKHFLDLSDIPTAIFLPNNAMTIGCFKAFSERGIKVPQDISIISYDDSNWAIYFTPSITVVRQPTYQMGAKAAEFLFQRIMKKGSYNQLQEIILKPKLEIRKSCRKV